MSRGKESTSDEIGLRRSGTVLEVRPDASAIFKRARLLARKETEKERDRVAKENVILGLRSSRESFSSEPHYEAILAKHLNESVSDALEIGEWDSAKKLVKEYTEEISAKWGDVRLSEEDLALAHGFYLMHGKEGTQLDALSAWVQAKGFLPALKARAKLDRAYFDPYLNAEQNFEYLQSVHEAVALAILQRGNAGGHDSPGWVVPNGRMLRFKCKGVAPVVRLEELRPKDLVYVRDGYLQAIRHPSHVTEGYIHLINEQVEDIYFGSYRHPARHLEIPPNSRMSYYQAGRLLPLDTIVQTVSS